MTNTHPYPPILTPNQNTGEYGAESAISEFDIAEYGDGGGTENLSGSSLLNEARVINSTKNK